MKQEKILHILIIIVGSIALLVVAFHTNVDNDQAYTISMNHLTIENEITGIIEDVHPILYYMILRLFTSIFGEQIINCRIFSLIPVILLGVLGYTHIKKEFGDKVGRIFSLLVFCLPSMLIEANNIRMYSWSALFVALSAIYAYRFKFKNKRSDCIWFAIFSLMAAYTHYFATFTIVLINLILGIVLLRTKEKAKFRKFLIVGIGEIILFIPGIIIFIHQVTKVGKSYWITVKYPSILINTMTFFLSTINNNRMFKLVIIFLEIIISVVGLNVLKRCYKDRGAKLAILFIIMYGTIVIVSLIISIVKPIFIPRYTFPIVSLMIFVLSYVLANIRNKPVYYFLMICLLFLSLVNFVGFYKKVYSENNEEIIEIVEKNVEGTDMFVYNNLNFASRYSNKFSKYNNIAYCPDALWDIKTAYKAMNIEITENLDFIDKQTSRIWVIEDGNRNITNNVDSSTIIFQQEYFYPYMNINLYITLLDHKN